MKRSILLQDLRTVSPTGFSPHYLGLRQALAWLLRRVFVLLFTAAGSAFAAPDLAELKRRAAC